MRTIITSARWHWLARLYMAFECPGEVVRVEKIDAESARKRGIILRVKQDAESDEIDREAERVFLEVFGFSSRVAYRVCLWAMLFIVVVTAVHWFASNP